MMNDIYDVEVLELIDVLMDRFLEARGESNENPKEFKLTVREVKMIENQEAFYKVDKKGKATFLGVPIKIIDKL